MEILGSYVSLELGFFLLPSLFLCMLVGVVWWRRSARNGRSGSSYPAEEGPLPPAPPVLGHLQLLGELPHQTLAELARRHGPNLMSLRLGSVLAIVASTPETAQLILQTHDPVFSSRPRTAAPTHMGFNSSDIVASPPNAYWRRMRQLCATDLFSNKRVHSFQPIRREGIHELLRAAFMERGQAMQVRPKLLTAALNIISRMTIGRRLSEVSPEATDMISEMMHLGGVFNLGDCIPFLAFLDLQGYERRMKLVGQRWSSLLQGVLDLRRASSSVNQKLEGGNKETRLMDLLDILCSVPDLTDNNIKAVIGDMFVAGTETSSITIEWALAELLANPTTMRVLQEELDKVVGRTRHVEEEDLDKLPYLHAVVKEAMRLHPVAPFLMPHESIQACKVYGYMIPAKARVLVNVWAIGRDPSVWENPLKFEPERFMPEGRYNDVHVYGQHFQLLPFGSGRRKCPALTLGLLSVHIVLASVVHAFNWALPPASSKNQSVDFSEKFGISVTMASPLSSIPTPRLEESLYY